MTGHRAPAAWLATAAAVIAVNGLTGACTLGSSCDEETCDSGVELHAPGFGAVGAIEVCVDGGCRSFAPQRPDPAVEDFFVTMDVPDAGDVTAIRVTVRDEESGRTTTAAGTGEVEERRPGGGAGCPTCDVVRVRLRDGAIVPLS